MNSSIELQKQIKDNAEDVRRFVADLTSWTDEMKRKESGSFATTSKENLLPPVRNSPTKRDSLSDAGVPTRAESQSVKKRISSSDYAAWEKFNVEEACEEIEKRENGKESEEQKQIREKRLRDEAYVEKEKGNLFVKKEKWDSAIECYSKAIKCYAQDAIFYCNRALCYLKKKDFRAAETDCTSALTLDNTYVKALHRRSMARKELNQLDEAVADLKRAIEIEPNNTTIARDYNTLRMKLGQINVNTVVVAETIQSDAEIIFDINIDKKSDPILPAKKHRVSTSVHKDDLDATKSNVMTVWPKIDDTVKIEPIFIPPHKRSKKPMQRIMIQDDTATIIPDRELALPNQSSQRSKAVIEEKDTRAFESKVKETPSMITNQTQTQVPKPNPVSSGNSPLSASNIQISYLPKVVPQVPRNSVQFIAGWRQVNKDSQMCFQYLKKINGDDFPKIFQDSLDGNILSQILKVLAKEFIAANEPVLSYLKGLTKVRRFRTLTLFLSKLDKDYLDMLFKHTQALENTSPDVIMLLKEEYEL